MTQDTYPGSNTPIPARSEPVVEENYDYTWADNPRVMVVNGREVEFFTISALAQALNREVVTIRKWERQGYLPKARYRTAGKKQDRLYTYAQIEGIVAIAREEGLMDPEAKVRIQKTNFTQRVTALFNALAEA